MRAKLVAVIVLYFFIVNALAISLAYTADNELEQTFSNPGEGVGSFISFIGELGNYFFKLMTFQISGINQFVSFMIFYVPVIMLVVIIAEMIRGN